ncbi:MAG: RNA repair domain-containing protein [Candidatus Methanofastidiosia archaeon]
MRPREFLNMLKWHPSYDFKDYSIVYLHRGAPKNEKVIECFKVLRLEHSDFVIEGRFGEVNIPYHRIKRILDKKGKVVWEKRKPQNHKNYKPQKKPKSWV